MPIYREIAISLARKKPGDKIAAISGGTPVAPANWPFQYRLLTIDTKAALFFFSSSTAIGKCAPTARQLHRRFHRAITHK